MIRANLSLASPLDFRIWKSKLGYFGQFVTDDAVVVELAPENNFVRDEDNNKGAVPGWQGNVIRRRELP